jgi:hypothetical protein
LAVSLGLVSEERRREERGDGERRRVKSGKASLASRAAKES